MKIILLAIIGLLVFAYSQAQTFIPKDTILANNVFQVEFSDGTRSMVWCENLGGGQAEVWYADLDLNTGIHDFTNKQDVDTIQG